MKKVIIDTLLICSIIYLFLYFFAINDTITEKVNYDNRDLYQQYSAIEPIDHVQIDEDTSYYVYEEGDKVIVDRYEKTLGDALGYYPILMVLSVFFTFYALPYRFLQWIKNRKRDKQYG